MQTAFSLSLHLPGFYVHSVLVTDYNIPVVSGLLEGDMVTSAYIITVIIWLTSFHGGGLIHSYSLSLIHPCTVSFFL